MRVMCRLTSSGTHRHSSRSSAKSYGATTPIPVCCSGRGMAHGPSLGGSRTPNRKTIVDNRTVWFLASDACLRTRPVVAVLCENATDRPPGLEGLDVGVSLLRGRRARRGGPGSAGAAALGFLLHRRPRRVGRCRPARVDSHHRRRRRHPALRRAAGLRRSGDQRARRVRPAAGGVRARRRDRVRQGQPAPASTCNGATSGGTARRAASPAQPRWWSAPGVSGGRSRSCCGRPGWWFAARAAGPSPTTPTSARSSTAPTWRPKSAGATT